MADMVETIRGLIEFGEQEHGIGSSRQIFITGSGEKSISSVGRIQQRMLIHLVLIMHVGIVGLVIFVEEAGVDVVRGGRRGGGCMEQRR